jgi:hypothetical protein
MDGRGGGRGKGEDNIITAVDADVGLLVEEGDVEFFLSRCLRGGHGDGEGERDSRWVRCVWSTSQTLSISSERGKWAAIRVVHRRQTE